MKQNLPIIVKVRKILDAIPRISCSRILISFSGGPDSTVLMHTLDSLTKHYNYKLFALYLDHGIRPRQEMALELKHVQSFCRTVAMELRIAQISPGLIESSAANQGRSIEELAREKRYHQLQQQATALQADYIALGHTCDDQLETLIMRFFQGSGHAGLTGIPVIADKLIRPLFYCSKQEILNYLAEHKLTYSIDQSNLKEDYLRNQVRHTLIPVIKDIFPGYRSSLLNLAVKMEYLKTYLDANLAQVDIKKADHGYRLSCNQFRQLPVALQISVIYRIFNLLTALPGDKLPFRFIKPLLGKEAEQPIKLRGHGISIFRQEAELFFKRDIVYNRKKGYLMVDNTGSGAIFENSGLTIRLICEVAGKWAIKNSPDIVLKKQSIRLPLTIRSRISGDRINSGFFSKSLKKVFTDWGVDESEKWLIPVIADKNGILALAGKSFGYRNLVVPEHSNVEENEQVIKIIIEEHGEKKSG